MKSLSSSPFFYLSCFFGARFFPHALQENNIDASSLEEIERPVSDSRNGSEDIFPPRDISSGPFRLPLSVDDDYLYVPWPLTREYTTAEEDFELDIDHIHSVEQQQDEETGSSAGDQSEEDRGPVSSEKVKRKPPSFRGPRARGSDRSVVIDEEGMTTPDADEEKKKSAPSIQESSLPPLDIDEKERNLDRRLRERYLRRRLEKRVRERLVRKTTPDVVSGREVLQVDTSSVGEPPLPEIPQEMRDALKKEIISDNDLAEMKLENELAYCLGIVPLHQRRETGREVCGYAGGGEGAMWWRGRGSGGAGREEGRDVKPRGKRRAAPVLRT